MKNKLEFFLLILSVVLTAVFTIFLVNMNAKQSHCVYQPNCIVEYGLLDFVTLTSK